MSFNNLSIVLGGNGVVNPANFVEMSSAEVDDGDEMSDDLLLLRLPPVELLSKIMFKGGGWVRKQALDTPNMGPYCCIVLAMSITFDEDSGVLGKIRFGGDFAFKEVGDKIDDTGDDAVE